MLSWRAARGDETLATGRRRDSGGCFCLSGVADEFVATLSECGATSVTEAECGEGHLQVAEASCPEEKGGGRGSRPMVVVQVQGRVDSVSCLSVARSHRPLFPQQRSYQLHSSPSSSSLPCLQDADPMVALECELPLSGRLSPPGELTRSMSAPFLISMTAGGAADPVQHLNHGAADPDPAHTLALGGDSSHHTGSSEHLSGSLAPASPYPASGLSRSGAKRKLPRREDAICEEEDVELVEGQIGEHSCQNAVLSITRGWFGDECEDVSGRKKRRLHDREVEGGMDMNSVTLGGEDWMSESMEEPRNNVTVQQQVNCVVYDSFGTVSVSTIPSAAETEVSLNVVVEDSPDSVVEVDVVGDDGEGTLSSKLPGSSVDVIQQDGPADTEHGSSEEASSEDGEDDTFLMTPRPPRISPFLNTPKQRKEERRKILKMSIHKMRAVEDPEHFLRRSVLINNTMKRLQRELREEKMRNNPRRSCYGLYRRASSLHYDVLNNSYLIHDEPFAISENDRITDDMTDALVTKLEATSSPVVPTPSPSPCPAEEPDTSSMAFPIPSSQSSTWSSDVSSTVPDLSTHLTSDCLPEPSLSCPGEFVPSLSPSSSETVSTTSGADMASISPSPLSSPSSASSPSSCTIFEGVFNVPGLGRDTQSPTSSCSSQSQREKQLYADIDTVFNNLIHALGDS